MDVNFLAVLKTPEIVTLSIPVRMSDTFQWNMYQTELVLSIKGNPIKRKKTIISAVRNAESAFSGQDFGVC